MGRICITLLAIVVTFVAVPESTASDWARSMFATTTHDFGTVARAAETEYSFTFTNRLNQAVHVSHVRTSCGCTTPRVEKNAVGPGEQGAVIAKLNTRSFSGSRGATVTVVFDRPYYAEVQLRVTSYIRSDVVFNPGQVDFGSVTQGKTLQRTINLQYAGRSDWRIVEIRSPLPHLSAKAVETSRGYGRVGYSIVVQLDSSAPAEYIDTELTIRTNDRGTATVPLSVTGRITSALTLSPALVYLGNVHVGEQAHSRLVVRGPKPFQITEIQCEDERFKFITDGESRTLHLIPIVFTADNNAGKVQTKIRIVTDLEGELTAETNATLTILDN